MAEKVSTGDGWTLIPTAIITPQNFEKFPEINTHFPKMYRSSPRSSYLGADYTDLRKIRRLLVQIPKGHPDPRVLRIE
jgi:hypothetical protein